MASAPSYVYFVQAEHGGPVKIGRSTDPAARLRGLQNGSAYKLVLRSVIPDTGKTERKMHDLFAKLRLEGEWFAPHPVMAKVGRVKVEGVDLEESNGTVELLKQKGDDDWAQRDIDAGHHTALSIFAHNKDPNRRGPRIK